ncbi:hypothetical protein KKF63_01630 [bacterium]|nr:hypothetical protein [bacterium]
MATRALHKQAHLGIMIIVALISINCGSASFESSSDSSASSTSVVAGNISALTLSENSSTEITLADVEDDEDIMLVLYSYNSSSSATGVQLGTSAPDVSSQFLGKANLEEDITQDFHQQIRSLESNISDDAAIASEGKSSFLKYATSVGSTKSFKVLSSLSSTSSYDTITAELRYTTSHFEFYVDTRNEDAINDDDLEELADNFEVTQLQNLFGTESDVDSNGKFAVLFTQAVNELGASAGGIVTGFFYAVDLFDDSQYSVSNEMEVFYTLVPDEDGDHGTALTKSFCMSNIYPTVLPHEFQHMINFNQHYFLNSSSSEESWLNEGLSHLAEDISSIDSTGYITETSIENPSRVSSYLSNVADTCFSCGSSLSQRGGTYLFLRYIYEQAEIGNLSNVHDGADLIDLLLDTDKTGLDNVATALYGDSADEEDLQEVMGQFSLAVYLSNTGTTSNSKYNFKGINLRSTQDDNRSTTLSGPNEHSISSLNFTDTLSGLSMMYLNISGQDINDNGGSLTITVGSDGLMGGYVIRD